MRCFENSNSGLEYTIVTFNDATERRSHKVILNGIDFFQLSPKLR